MGPYTQYSSLQLKCQQLLCEATYKRDTCLEQQQWMPSSIYVGLLRGPRLWSQQTSIRISLRMEIPMHFNTSITQVWIHVKVLFIRNGKSHEILCKLRNADYVHKCWTLEYVPCAYSLVLSIDNACRNIVCSWLWELSQIDVVRQSQQGQHGMEDK